MRHVRYLVLIVALLLFSQSVFAGAQVPPLTSGAAQHFSSTSLSTSPVVVLNRDLSRGFLQIQNTSANTNTLACTVDGTTPVVGGNGVQMLGLATSGGGSATYDVFVPTGIITCVGSASSTAYTITYLP